MSISYNKLWKLLLEKRMNKSTLKERAGISFNVLAKLGKQKPVSLDSLNKICKVLQCDIGDIMEFTDLH